MAFAKSDLFNSNSTPEYNPFESVKEMRARFEPDTKVLVALGGWGDTEGFGEGSKDDESRERYAKNVAAVVKDGGFDGVGMSPYHLCYDTGEDKELRRIRHRLGIPRRQRRELQRNPQLRKNRRNRRIPQIPRRHPQGPAPGQAPLHRNPG